MKKILLLASLALLGTTAFAKKVKFAVDMTGQTLTSNGVHVTGDFQVAAGFPANWAYNTTPLTQEGSTGIYSTVVDIPAGAKYEYRFANGDQGYNTEFVPTDSRVNGSIDDNRWLYVDSLANDTTYVGAILFGGNAPAGLALVRFEVNLTNQSAVPATGVHVAGGFQGSNPATTHMYSFADSIWQYIAYVTPGGTYDFQYINGNTAALEEAVPSACSPNADGKRSITVTADTVLPAVCFNQCTVCAATTGIATVATQGLKVFPNPVQETTTVAFNDGSNTHSILLTDVQGRTVRNYSQYTGNTLSISRNGLQAGLYLLHITGSNGALLTTVKLVLQ